MSVESVNGAAETMSRVASEANEQQQLNLDFINYICDLSDGSAVSDASGVTDEETMLDIDADSDGVSDYQSLDDAFGDLMFDEDGTSSLIADGEITSGGASMVSYITQQISDTITVFSSLTKSTQNIEKNTAQQLGRDLAQ